MDAPWWDQLHWTLWRIADCPAVIATAQAARQVASNVAAPLLDRGADSCCEWTAPKAELLPALDAGGLTSLLSSAQNNTTMHLAMAAWELAWVDSGPAACNLSGCLAQMPIREFGSAAQRARYLDNPRFRHGALCLTEALPGAGSDALFLEGSFQAVQTESGEIELVIEKRGRFTSHMDFADFVVAAVQARGAGVQGSALVILEPGDAGEFERGAAVRKLGYRMASTTNPVFRLRVSVTRIIGGHGIEDGKLSAKIDHRRCLGAALRRARAILSLMTAVKALATVQELAAPCRASADSQLLERTVELWAVGEAAASLGFAATRACDEMDSSGITESLADVLVPAAKLFSTSQVSSALQRLVTLGEWNVGSSSLHRRLADAQVEAVYMGPQAMQRRQLTAAMSDERFLKTFDLWTNGMEADGQVPLAAGMRLWRWTMEQMCQQRDGNGTRLYADARQGVGFSMADGLCGLLAAHSLATDVMRLESSAAEPSVISCYRDLAALAAALAASRVARFCEDLILGYRVNAATANAFLEMRSKMAPSLYATEAARQRAQSTLHPMLGMTTPANPARE